MRACLATAVDDGLIRSNPAQRVRLPHRPKPEEEHGEHVRALTREQLAAFLELVHPRHRLMFRLLATTGLRVSELLALQWRHLRLDGSEPGVRVRRAYVRGRVEPPKSKHGKRDVPLEPLLVSDLRAWRKATEWPAKEDLVFPSLRGTPLEAKNVLRRVLRPVAEKIGAPWAGFHTFRLTCASMLFERGANAVQVQRWLGHHSASFTLERYVHLLRRDLGEPLRLSDELGEVRTQVQTSAALGASEEAAVSDVQNAA